MGVIKEDTRSIANGSDDDDDESLGLSEVDLCSFARLYYAGGILEVHCKY